MSVRQENRKKEIARLWLEGASPETIGPAVGIKPTSVAQAVGHMREQVGSPDTTQDVGGDTSTSYWYYGRVQLIFDNGTLTRINR